MDTMSTLQGNLDRNRLENERLKQEHEEIQQLQQECKERLRPPHKQVSQAKPVGVELGDGTRTLINLNIIQPPTLKEFSSYGMSKMQLQLWKVNLELLAKKNFHVHILPH